MSCTSLTVKFDDIKTITDINMLNKVNKLSNDMVSVVIPVYNAEAYLQQTLESVLSQTYPNLEVIAIDDGSNDGSIALLQRYSGRIRMIRQDNKGAANARNKGVREAKGFWIAFLDADDIWAPDKIEHQLRECGNYAWSHTDSIFLGGINHGKKDSELNNKYKGKVLKRIICYNFISTSTLMVRRDIFLNSGGFDESFRSVHDWELWIRIAEKFQIGFVEAPLTTYRVHSVSVSRNTRKTLPNHLKVIKKSFSEDGPGSSLNYLKRSALGNSYSICSQIAEEESDYVYSLYYALNAIFYEAKQVYRWERLFKIFIKFLLSLLRQCR